MAKATFKKGDDGLTPVRVTAVTSIGITRFIPGRVYRVDDAVLGQLDKKAIPADD